MAALTSLLKPPMTPNGANYKLVWRMKVFDQTTAAGLETAVNAWIAMQEATENTFFASPVSLGIAAGRFAMIIPYGVFAPP